MKKVLFCAAAVAMLGLASCSSKADNANDTANLDSDTLIGIEQVTEVAIDSADSSAVINQATEVVEEVVPADSAK
ncbi:MAG: hypothetical protein K2J15_02550 [Muribaculaceae bacterium]|nr:hypothetical protein [Muribaculaceae bacterium]